MPFTIAILADIHLPDTPGTAQEAALSWALERVRRADADVTVVAGDVTAMGTSSAARRFRSMLQAALPEALITPGNSELRTPGQTQTTLELLHTPWHRAFPRAEIVLLDDTSGHFPDAERRKLESIVEERHGRVVVLVTHIPPDKLPAEDQEWLHGRVSAGMVSLIIAGHRHRDSQGAFAGVPFHVVRGLDPDKAIGGAPCAALFELAETGRWQRRDLVWDQTPACWIPDQRHELTDLLGYSCMHQPLAGLREAARRHIRVLELRARPSLEIRRPDLTAAVQAWRDCGGRTLSLHQAQLGWDDTTGRVTGGDAFRGAVELALELNAQALTVHAPRATVAQLADRGPARGPLVQAYADLLRPAVQQGMTVGIENLHLTRGEPTDRSRRYGYTPAECLEWIQSLEPFLGRQHLGLHLDIGHARNNGVFGSRFPLGSWYALTGSRITGYHLHQVIKQDGAMANHFPFTGLHGPLISLSSFLWAWRTGQLAHAPMYIEVRGPGQSWAAWDRLHAELEAPGTGSATC